MQVAAKTRTCHPQSGGHDREHGRWKERAKPKFKQGERGGGEVLSWICCMLTIPVSMGQPNALADPAPTHHGNCTTASTRVRRLPVMRPPTRQLLGRQQLPARARTGCSSNGYAPSAIRPNRARFSRLVLRDQAAHVFVFGQVRSTARPNRSGPPQRHQPRFFNRKMRLQFGTKACHQGRPRITQVVDRAIGAPRLARKH